MERGRTREFISLVNRPVSGMFASQPGTTTAADIVAGGMETKIPRKRPPPEDEATNGSEGQKRKQPMRAEKKEGAEEEGEGRFLAVKPHASESKDHEVNTRKERPEVENNKKKEIEEDTEKKYKFRESRKRETQRSREKKVRENFYSKNIESSTEEEKENKEEEEKTFEFVLTGKADTGRKNSNILKIYRQLSGWRKNIEAIRMIGKNKAEVIVRATSITREVMRKFGGEQREGQGRAYIPNRYRERWGVVRDWDGSIKELEEEIVPGQNVIGLEKMKKRTKIEGGFEWRETQNVLVKYKGASLPTKMVIMDGFVNLRVTPYIRAVKQCYNCLKFGHIKKNCRDSYSRCFNCAEQTHGRCDKKPRCRNCGGEHGALARVCKWYELEQRINTLIAYRNLSFEEARTEARRELGFSRGREEEEEETRFPLNRRREMIKRIPRWEDQPVPGSRNRWVEEPGSLTQTWNRDRDDRKEIRETRENRNTYREQNQSRAAGSATNSRMQGREGAYERPRITNIEAPSREQKREAERRERRRKEEQDNKDIEELMRMIREKGWEEIIKKKMDKRIGMPLETTQQGQTQGRRPSIEEEDWSGDGPTTGTAMRITRNQTKSGGHTSKAVQYNLTRGRDERDEETTKEVRREENKEGPITSGEREPENEGKERESEETRKEPTNEEEPGKTDTREEMKTMEKEEGKEELEITEEMEKTKEAGNGNLMESSEEFRSPDTATDQSSID